MEIISDEIISIETFFNKIWCENILLETIFSEIGSRKIFWGGFFAGNSFCMFLLKLFPTEHASTNLECMDQFLRKLFQ